MMSSITITTITINNNNHNNSNHNNQVAVYSDKANSLRLASSSWPRLGRHSQEGRWRWPHPRHQAVEPRYAYSVQGKTCIQGKQHHRPITGTMTRATELLQIIHSDVCGPMKTPTPEGYKYFVSMIDDYSKMSAVTLIKQKSDALLQAVADFINMAQTQLSKHVKSSTVTTAVST